MWARVASPGNGGSGHRLAGPWRDPASGQPGAARPRLVRPRARRRRRRRARVAATRSPPGSPAPARAGSSRRAAATPCACCCCAAACRTPAARSLAGTLVAEGAGECATGALLLAVALVVGVGPQLGASTATVALVAAGLLVVAALLALARRSARVRRIAAGVGRGCAPLRDARRLRSPRLPVAARPAAPAGSARSPASSRRSGCRPRPRPSCWSRSRRAGAGCCRSLPPPSAPASRCSPRASAPSPAAPSRPSGWPRSTSARARC